MEFHLYYRGRLKGNAGIDDKQSIRRYFHRQLKELWTQKPLGDYQPWLIGMDEDVRGPRFLRTVGQFTFVPLVNERVDLIAELELTLLRPEAPGSIITQTGDIDNRLKTLFDALRMPKNESEMPKGDTPQEGENRFFVLLEDDNLIQHVSVRTDRLLEPVNDQLEVVLLIGVKTKITRATLDNLGLGV